MINVTHCEFNRLTANILNEQSVVAISYIIYADVTDLMVSPRSEFASLVIVELWSFLAEKV